jgi:hypothetical protein
VDGRIGPRTGASERIVLAHCVGTHWVAFVVGNACSNRFCRIWLLMVADVFCILVNQHVGGEEKASGQVQ